MDFYDDSILQFDGYVAAVLQILKDLGADAHPRSTQADRYCTTGPNGARSIISIRVPQGSVM